MNWSVTLEMTYFEKVFFDVLTSKVASNAVLVKTDLTLGIISDAVPSPRLIMLFVSFSESDISGVRNVPILEIIPQYNSLKCVHDLSST